jgi:hypothetical protein
MALVEAAKEPVAKAEGEPVDEEPTAKAEGEPVGEEPTAKAEGEEEDEKMAALQKAHADALAAEVAKREALEAEVAKRDEATRLAGFVAKANADMPALPGIKAAELGALLAKAASVLDDADMARLQGVLQGASAAIAKSTLVKAQGSDGDQVSAAGKLDHEINLLRKAHPELSPEQALYRVAKTQSATFKAALDER